MTVGKGGPSVGAAFPTGPVMDTDFQAFKPMGELLAKKTLVITLPGAFTPT